MEEKSCDNIPDFVEISNLEEVPHIIEERDLETLATIKVWWGGSFVFSTRICRQWGYKRALPRDSRKINKMSFSANKIRSKNGIVCLYQKELSIQ